MRAKQSDNGKFVICGRCEGSLCRRDQMGPPTRAAGFYLVWGDGWRQVEDHIERQVGSVDRLAAGHPPTRHGWTNEERISLTRLLLTYPDAKCDACGELNEIDPKRLRVKGIAPYA